ncbi:MAG: glutamine synthetase III [Bacteroidales bacterium]|nr:glutamine synthetase III [Bacteroidales bacterium]
MAILRFKALTDLMNREVPKMVFTEERAPEIYGELVFNDEAMKKYLQTSVYKQVKKAIESGELIGRDLADGVAAGMKAWAIDHGAAHYSHWFQPLTDGTAEKHDGFINYGPDGKVIEEFAGKHLAQQEPDASSFPNGGIRQTFEARGYTAWDVTSPAFIVGSTLCIPTIFISYTGDALDYKTPLLKAIHAVDKAAVDVCQYFDKNVTKVVANLGWEQEYFLVDRGLYLARPDLVMTGRTLMGHASSKNQQLDDHYFGSIPERVAYFMRDLEIECHRLGIPAKTRHNEVAPGQFELAPIYEEANIANDHNLLLMDIMKRIAKHHGFEVILHEKPFAGVNGSGKHNNWSLCTNTGINLFAPGKNPKGNMLFLTFLTNVMAAVHKGQDILRAQVLNASNSHRLGANEAPPAIMSIFLGTQVSAMLNSIVEKVSDSKMTPEEKTALKLGIGRLPEILVDNTDRNRTSPFAFTGDRFEFRAVGSSANCAGAMTAVNAIVADQLREFKRDVDALIDKGVKKDEAIFQIIRKLIVESAPIHFDGNGYSDEWKVEAAKRGLTNITDVPESIDTMLSDHSKKVYVKGGILTERELEARHEVEMEKFVKKVQIEARVMGDLVINHIVPTALSYQNILIQNVKGMKDVMGDEADSLTENERDLIRKVSEHVKEIRSDVQAMIDARKKANKIESIREKAYAYSQTVRPFLDAIRYHVDKLELIVDNEMWPLPKYRELLFLND